MTRAASPLERFVAGQDSAFARVLAELKAGRKESHWIWFTFPQLAGLGQSATSMFYGIANLAEACAYLEHDVLAPRLDTCTDLMLAWAGRRSAAAILGSIDALKFCSSMTLFEAAAQATGIDDPRFGRALDAFCQGRRDERTLNLLHIAPRRLSMRG